MFFHTQMCFEPVCMNKQAVGDHAFIVGLAQVDGLGCDDVSHTHNCLFSSLISPTGFPFGRPLLSAPGR